MGSRYAVDNNASTKIASNGGKNICPIGWHVPNDAEWTTLITGGESAAGGKLKKAEPPIGQLPISAQRTKPGLQHFQVATVDMMAPHSQRSATPVDGGVLLLILSMPISGHMNNYNTSCEISMAIRTFGFSVRCIRD